MSCGFIVKTGNGTDL